MVRLFNILGLAIFAVLSATQISAQSVANLLADRITLNGNSVLIAEGNVEIWQGTLRLEADQLRYDDRTGKLTITGPIKLFDGTTTAVYAEAAELDRDLQTGILTGARIVLEQQLQIASAEVNRLSTRYLAAYDVAATSCQVCFGKTPIWQIRARRIVHDTQEKQLYFNEAQLRVFDIPIFYIPRLRLPDPSLKRATGFLIPQIKNSTLLGTGIKLPYFIRIGDDKDLTITPHISAKSKTVELRFRQAFKSGNIEFNGALSQDDILLVPVRRYLFGNGSFGLKRDYALSFQIQATSDPAYLLDYGYSSADRLHSYVELARAKRHQNVSLRFSNYRSLRATDDNTTLPNLVAEGEVFNRQSPNNIGGEFTYFASFFGSSRESTSPFDGPDPDLEVDGVDVGRLSVGAGWRNRWHTNSGLVFDVNAHVEVDRYGIREHAAFPAQVVNTAATIGTQIAWPLSRRSQSGAIDTLTPTLQIVWQEGTNSAVPNQDSTRVEFDEGNLFSLSRGPGHDLEEQGARANIGISWTRDTANGRRISASLGRIVRDQSPAAFTTSSGLSTQESDWLGTIGYSTPNGIDLLARGHLAPSGNFNKIDSRFSMTRPKASVAATYTWLAADLAENRLTETSELALNADYKITDHVTISNNFRYDFRVEEMANASIGLQYKNECIDVDFSVSRRFTSSGTVQPSTDYNFTVELLGFGTGAQGAQAKRQCGG